MAKYEKAAETTMRSMRSILLREDHKTTIEDFEGGMYHGMMRKCLSGEDETDMIEDDEETEGEREGARLQQTFSTEIVDGLGAIRL